MANTDPNRWVSKVVIFLSSQTISLFGSSVVGYAIIWYITLETSSGSIMTITILCTFLPQVLISLFAGVWADRYSRKKLIIYSDLFISIATLTLAAFFMSGMTTLYLIYLAAIVRSIGAGIQAPAVSAILPQIVPVGKLTRVNAINSTINSVMLLLAPAVGGLLLATAGFVYTLLFDVVTGLAAVIIISFLKMEGGQNLRGSCFHDRGFAARGKVCPGKHPDQISFIILLPDLLPDHSCHFFDPAFSGKELWG